MCSDRGTAGRIGERNAARRQQRGLQFLRVETSGFENPGGAARPATVSAQGR